jgi:hypothetical protein
MTKTVEFVYYLFCVGNADRRFASCRRPLGGADDGDWLANLDCSFGLVHRLVFSDAAVRRSRITLWHKPSLPAALGCRERSRVLVSAERARL